MNNNPLLSQQTRKLIYETLDHYWVMYPYKLTFGKKGSNSSSDWIHKDIELNLVTQDSVWVTLNGRRIKVNEGELFCVNSYVAHSFEFSSNSRYTHLIISTKYLNEHGVDPSKLVFNEIIRDPKIVDFFENLKSDNLFGDRYGITSAQGSILRLIAYIASRYSVERAPNENENSISSYGSDFEYTRKAIDYITDNLQSELTLEEISSAIGISKYHFSHIFNRITGNTLIEYINKVRCEYAKTLLQSGDISVKEAAISSGFNNFSYFAKTFKKHIGYLPSKLLQKENN